MMTVEQLRTQMELVNDYWMAQHPDVGDCAWERAAYFRGCMAAYEVLGKPAYCQQSSGYPLSFAVRVLADSQQERMNAYYSRMQLIWFLSILILFPVTCLGLYLS